MRIMRDYHVHSYLCRHGEGEIFEYVEAAIEKGLAEIGFAEHIPIPLINDPDGRMHFGDFETYVEDIIRAKKVYPEISIKFGLEADYWPTHMEFISQFINAYPFDFIIGSVHFIDDWDFSNPAFTYRIKDIGIDYVYQRYYQLIGEAARLDLYDVIGHFDLPKNLNVKPSIDTEPLVKNALKAVKSGDKVLDINTSGLRKKQKELYPATRIIKLARQMDIPIIIGSDAHRPADVAVHFDQTTELLRRIGYNSVCTFERRQRSFIPL